MKQAETFDPEGEFVKLWIPAMASCPTEFMHKPYEMTADQREECQIEYVEPCSPLVPPPSKKKKFEKNKSNGNGTGKKKQRKSKKERRRERMLRKQREQKEEEERLEQEKRLEHERRMEEKRMEQEKRMEEERMKQKGNSSGSVSDSDANIVSASDSPDSADSAQLML